MRTFILLVAGLITTASAALASDARNYVTSFVGDPFALVFPAQPVNGSTTVYRDARWALDVVEVKCDDKAIDAHEVQPAGVSPMPTDTISNTTLVYSLRSSEFIVCRGHADDPTKATLVEYRLPADFTKLVVKYRIRLPGRGGATTDISTMTAYLRPYFPSGREAPEDQRRG